MLSFAGQDILQQGRHRAPQQPGRAAGHTVGPGEQAPGLNQYGTEQVNWGDRHSASCVTASAAMEGVPELERHAQSSEQGHGLLPGTSSAHLLYEGDSPAMTHITRPPGGGGAPMTAFHPSRGWTAGRPPSHHPYRAPTPRHPYYSQYPRQPQYSSGLHPYSNSAPQLVGRRQHLGIPYGIPPHPAGFGGPLEEDAPTRSFTVSDHQGPAVLLTELYGLFIN